MASKQPEGKHSFASILLLVIIFGSIAIMTLVPIETFQKARIQEQEQIVKWLGGDSDQWIMGKIVDLLNDTDQKTFDFIDKAAVSGNQKIDRWMMRRVHALNIWLHLILYRVGMIGLWFVFLVPCLLAAFCDGYYQRQIAKASFRSQSPILHKSGIRIAQSVMALVLVWFFVPVHVPTVVAPVFIAAFSFAGWIWMANLQKRL